MLTDDVYAGSKIKSKRQQDKTKNKAIKGIKKLYITVINMKQLGCGYYPEFVEAGWVTCRGINGTPNFCVSLSLSFGSQVPSMLENFHSPNLATFHSAAMSDNN